MDASTINLLLQIPLAGVVVVVVVLFLKYLEKMTNQMITFMQQQADTNREFLKTQREQTNQAISRFNKLPGCFQPLPVWFLIFICHIILFPSAGKTKSAVVTISVTTALVSSLTAHKKRPAKTFSCA